MKVLHLACLTLFGFSLTHPLVAQFSLGVRGGVNLSNWAANDEFKDQIGNPEARLSPLAGIVAEIRFSDHLAVQPELGFVQKGFKLESTLSDPILGESSARTDYIVNYLEIPVLFKAGVALGALRIDGLAGPAFGYGLNAKSKDQLTVNGITTTKTDAIDFEDDEFNRMDLSAQAGLSISINFGEAVRIFVDGRYLYGFSNLNTSESPDAAYNRGIALGAGVFAAF